MGMPKIPDIDVKVDIDVEDVVNLILASIAFEELGLAHLINAEAEKVQAVLGTLEGGNKFDSCDVDDILKVNKSVRKTLQDIVKKEMLLQFKLEDILEMDFDHHHHHHKKK